MIEVAFDREKKESERLKARESGLKGGREDERESKSERERAKDSKRKKWEKGAKGRERGKGGERERKGEVGREIDREREGCLQKRKDTSARDSDGWEDVWQEIKCINRDKRLGKEGQAPSSFNLRILLCAAV